MEQPVLLGTTHMWTLQAARFALAAAVGIGPSSTMAREVLNRVCPASEIETFSCDTPQQTVGLCFSRVDDRLYLGERSALARTHVQITNLAEANQPLNGHGESVTLQFSANTKRFVFFINTNPYDVDGAVIQTSTGHMRTRSLCAFDSERLNTAPVTLHRKRTVVSLYNLVSNGIAVPLASVPPWPPQ